MANFATAEPDTNKIVSALARVEVRSALSRLHRAGAISRPDLDVALSSLDVELRRIVQQPLSQQVLDPTANLVASMDLRTLDAIQLASAIAARDTSSAPRMRFIAADNRLLAAAAQRQFEVWNPGAP